MSSSADVIAFIPSFRGSAVLATLVGRHAMRNTSRYRIQGISASDMASLRILISSLYPGLRFGRMLECSQIRVEVDARGGRTGVVHQSLDPTEVLTQLQLLRFRLVDVSRARDGSETVTDASHRIVIDEHDTRLLANELCSGVFELRMDTRHIGARPGKRFYSTDLVFVPSEAHTRSGVRIEPIHYPSEERAVVHSAAVGRRCGQFLFYVPRGRVVCVRFIVQPGIGAMHSRWSPIAYGGFWLALGRDTVRVEDTGVAENADLRRLLVEQCPSKVFDIEDAALVVRSDPEECVSCGLCQRVAAEHSVAQGVRIHLGALDTPVRPETEAYIFELGTEGEADTDRIMRAGFRMLHDAERSGFLLTMQKRHAHFIEDMAILSVPGYTRVTPDMVRLANAAVR